MNITSNNSSFDLELEHLTKYAEAANQGKVLVSQSDLDPKVRPASEMITWCRQQGNIVVLNDGSILTANPTSRTVQNCKIVMAHQGLRAEKVFAAHSSLIKILLENAEEPKSIQLTEIETVSTQQQRLRILVKEALAEKASDIHIEVRADIAKIRLRKHGELYLHAEWLPKLGREIASVAFNKETDHAVTHFNPFIPQSASMPLIIDGHEIRLRISSMPAHGGFDVVMRLLDTVEEKIWTLEELGYGANHIHILQKAITTPHGAVIISGPTGSGKTTTLASCMALVDQARKVYSIENPVEKVVQSITQVPVNSEQYDRTFASMGTAALRMDPNVIVLGEMRDLDTATVMIRAALTGHLVFSTLHTNSAAGIVTRLVEMGINAGLLADPNMLVCLVCQRLAPVLCKACAQPIGAVPEYSTILRRWMPVLGHDSQHVKVRGKFCSTCKGIGVTGRTVVAEVIWIDEAGREFIKSCDTLNWEKYLRANGWQSYRDQVVSLVKQGVCDPMDAERIVGDVNPVFHAQRFNYNTQD
jgi:type II secretory ATPase GspE/PulE/Tfp pilus assembly ATPase PilB-like protein